MKELSKEQEIQLNDLVDRLSKAGAKKPLQWARSEVREGIPQFGRFLVLKRLFEIIKSPEENIELASDYDDEIRDKFEEVSKAIGKQKLIDFLTSFSKGLVSSFIELLDEGNENANEDKVNWVLLKTDEKGEHTEQIIQGLHEDFFEFEDEIAE